MTHDTEHRRSHATGVRLTAALWVVSAVGCTVLAATEQAINIKLAEFAVALIAAMLACTRLVLLDQRHAHGWVSEHLKHHAQLRDSVMDHLAEDAVYRVAAAGIVVKCAGGHDPCPHGLAEVVPMTDARRHAAS